MKYRSKISHELHLVVFQIPFSINHSLILNVTVDMAVTMLLIQYLSE